MIKVFIIDDHVMIIEGLVSLLQYQQNIKVVGVANDAETCIKFCKQHTVDVLITDISMPNISGIELCKTIKTTFPSINIIALSTFSDGTYITKMIENGASGYLLKNANKEEIIEAIETVNTGKQYLPFDVQKIYTLALEKKEQQPILTKREKEILKLIAEGFSNLQIGQQLFISVDTVDSHRKNLYSKLNVKNTALLIKVAMEEGLL